jgi:hypothetical protein
MKIIIEIENNEEKEENEYHNYQDMKECFDSVFVDSDYWKELGYKKGFSYADEERKKGGYNYSHLNIFEELDCFIRNKLKERMD